MWQLIKSFFRWLIGLLDKASGINTTPTPTPTPTPTIQHSSAWADYPSDLKLGLIQLVRSICGEMGITDPMVQTMICIIQAESGFNPFAINKNANGTTDYGLCMFNDGKNAQGVPYWIGEGAEFSSPEEVLNNPEKCIRVMAKVILHGGIHNWSSYNNGGYKYWLKYSDQQLADFQPKK